MKPFFIVTLCLLMLFQALSKVLIMADYEVNKTYIAAVLCVNKSKPKMNCNGKCHLVKQLQQEDNSAQTTPTNLKHKSEVQWQWLTPVNKFSFTSSFIAIGSHSRYIERTYTAPKRRIFHPPAVTLLFNTTLAS